MFLKKIAQFFLETSGCFFMPVNQFPCKRTILYGKIYIQPVYLRLYYLNNEQLLKTR